MTTKDGGEITAMGLFRESLDHEVKTLEGKLVRDIEALERELARTRKYLAEGNRVYRNGPCQTSAVEIDRTCGILNQLYDTRIALNAALAHDEKNTDLGLHRGSEKGGA
jgi:hypothetical protein